MFDPIINFLETIHPMPAQLKKELLEKLSHMKIRKKELLLREGEVSNYIYFVQKGLLRAFYLKDGEEITSWFMKEKDVVVSIYSFFRRMPSYENIEVLEEGELFYIHYDDLQRLYSRFMEFNIIGRILTEHYYVLSEERLIIMRKQKAQDRYEYFLERHADIANRLPIEFVASYLGLTRRTLTRIRSTP